MFSKHQLAYNPEDLQASKRFRANAADLFLTNTVSAARAASLFEDAVAAGTQHVKDLGKISSGKRKKSKNKHRDLLRALARRSAWPKLYLASIRVWNRKTQSEEVQEVPVLLPHEVIAEIAHKSDLDTFASRENLSPSGRAHLEKSGASMGLDGGPIVSIGLWLDGTPCNWDRSESVQTFAYSFPGVARASAALRLPFAVMLDKHCVVHNTFDDLLAIFVWSLKCLAIGVYPTVRHDGHPFDAVAEKHRAAKGGTPLSVRGLLTEIRGDWKCMKEVFRLPGWQEARSCCWKCTANHETRRNCTSEAPWRAERLSHWDMLTRWRRDGVNPCSIVCAPFFDMSLFQMDWLHVMDLGVSCDFLGNLFCLLLPHKHGASRSEKIKNLYRDMVEYYSTYQPDGRLDNLTENMLGKRGQPPKLRARGAEAKGLITFAREQAEAHLADNDPEEAAAKQAAIHLEACYRMLHKTIYDHAAMANHSKQFCVLYAALERVLGQDSPKWRMKPKVHLMQELCEMSAANPSLNWTYRDEDFGGSMAGFARVRGGRATAKVVGRNVLTKFQARHSLPVFRS